MHHQTFDTPLLDLVRAPPTWNDSIQSVANVDTWYRARKSSMDETPSRIIIWRLHLQRYRYSFTNGSVNTQCSPPMPCVRVPRLPPLDMYRSNLLHKGRWVSLEDVKCDFHTDMITPHGWPNFNNTISMVRVCRSACRVAVVW